MSSEADDRALEREAKNRSRRAFLTSGAAAVAAYGGWHWLRSSPEVDGVPWPIREVLRVNERVAGSYFSDRHLSPTFPPAKVDPETRVNGDVGLGDDFDPRSWMLRVEMPEAEPRLITMAQIRELPRVEQITQLNCIEGWTAVVHWVGARFADFTAQYATGGLTTKYVGMQTPDERYFVGLDAVSALHPQTLLCYEMNGQPLTADHGAPLRLVIPVKYGVKNIKRIGAIQYTDRRPDDYWAKEGYDWYAGL